MALCTVSTVYLYDCNDMLNATEKNCHAFAECVYGGVLKKFLDGIVGQTRDKTQSYVKKERGRKTYSDGGDVGRASSS